MAALLWFPVVVPALAAAAAFGSRRRAWTTTAPLAVSVLLLGCALALLWRVNSGPTSLSAMGGLLRCDHLSAYLLTVVGLVALTATWGGRSSGTRVDGWYAGLLCLFLGAMSLALLADNLGVMWVAVEATTVATAFLVGYRGGPKAAEASWKYVILGSVGVAMALLGVVLIYAAGGASGARSLSWSALMAQPQLLDPALLRTGVALAALGFATKAGLAPLHTWLPDAHSQAPAAVSALMSGVLVSVAFATVLRVQALSDAVLGPGLMRGLLLAAGLLSLLVAAALMFTQRDYKRLLAYSTIEHMGILAIGAAIGTPVALAAVLLHVLGHGLLKAVLFVTSGRVLRLIGNSSITSVRSLLAQQPFLGGTWLAAMAGLAGFPPSALFLTEAVIVFEGFRVGLGWAMGAVLVLLLVAVAGLARHTLAMTVGPLKTAPAQTAPNKAVPDAAAHLGSGRRLPLVLALGAVAVVAFIAPLQPVLSDAAAALAGAR